MKNFTFFSFAVGKKLYVSFLSALGLMMLLMSGSAFGQNSYLGLDGGLEGTATVDPTFNASAPTGNNGKWTTAGSTVNQSAIALETSTVRSGSKSLKISGTSTTLARVWTPSVNITATTSKFFIQYYRRSASNTNTQQMQLGVLRGGTEQSNGTYASVTSANTWEKVTYAPTAVTSVTNVAGVLLNKALGSGGDYFVDDFVIYSDTAVDNLAPSVPGAITFSGQTTSSIGVSWGAASGGVDGGGYIVVRGTVDPTTAPNVNGIYAAGNTIAAGMTVVYQGTGTSFTDSSLSAGTTYYYRIYTYDKAYNYSAAATGSSATISAGFTVTFNGNTATGGSMASQTSAVAANLNLNAFTKTGYSFLKWTTAADGTGTSYADGASYPFTANATLYAQWYTTPTITTTVASSITNNAAASGGNVTSDGGASVTARGVYFGTSAAPSSGTSDGSGTGSYASALSSLAVNTQYFYRAYATNSAGTSYGTEHSFYTLANVPSPPTVATPTSTSLNVSITSGDGNPAATQYAIHETSANKFVQANGSLGTTEVWQAAAAWATKTVTGLTPATTYTFETKARNGAAVETAYSTTASGTTIADEVLDDWDLHSPQNQTLPEGNTFDVFAQAYKAGLTEAAGEAPGLKAWIGYSSSDTNPNGAGWTWIPATFNAQAGNNDEFKATLGAGLTPGTYYYASRFQLGSGTYQYGGYQGDWNNNSGVLTVTSNVVTFANIQSPYLGTITQGGDFNVDAQVYKAGITDIGSIDSSKIKSWIGISTTNATTESDFSTWTWIPATYQTKIGNNFEYYANIAGASRPAGTYYYVSRFQVAGSTEYRYGGTNNNFWTGAANSGVLTVQTPQEINIKQASTSIATGGTYAFGNQISGTSSSAISFTVENLGQAVLNVGTLSISGTNASEFSITQAASSTVNGGSSTTFTVTFSPTSLGAKTAQLSLVNNDSNKNPYLINLTGTGTRNTASDITVKTGYAYPQNIPYANYQAVDITGGSNDVEIAKFTIRDGGATADADNLATVLTQLTLSTTNSANIRRIALYDGATEIAEQAGAASNIFTGLNLTAPDNGTKDFSVRVSFNTAVTDNQQIVLGITATTTASAAGSGFAATNAGGAVTSSAGDDNRIEVTADRLVFVQQPTDVGAGNNMAPAVTVSANDSNANRDLDFVSNISITSTGTLTGAPVAVAATGGISTFSTLVHTAAGGPFNLKANASTFTEVVSNAFNVQLISRSTDYFRSKGTGNWNVAGSWESSATNNGTDWIASTLVPNSSANMITVRSGNNISVTTSITVDQLVIENGGQLTVPSNSGTVNINDGPGVDLDLRNGGVLQITENSSYASTIKFNGNSTMEVSGTITIGDGTNVNGSGYNDLTGDVNVIWNTDAVFEWNSTGSLSASGITYFKNVDSSTIPVLRISRNIAGTVGGGSATVINGILEVTGSVTFAGSGGKTFRNGIIGSGSVTQTAAGGFFINGDTAKLGGGTLTLTNTGLDISPTTVLNVTTNKVVNSGLIKNNGTLIFGTNVISGTGSFTQAAGATIVTSNTGGVPGSVAVPGTKTFTADLANYTFNAATSTPFITGTGQSTKFATVNANADVTNNISGVTTFITSALNVNTGTFSLNSAANSDLSLSNTNGVLYIADGATFDNGGENKISSSGGTPAIIINGSFITRDAQGFTGTNTSIPSIVPTLGDNSTIVYGKVGDQVVTNFAYRNITFAGSGTKTAGTTNSITGTVTVNSGVVLDADSKTFGGAGTNLTMQTNSLFKTGGAGGKPDAAGTYTLDPNSTIEFQGTSATLIKVSKTFEKIVVSGTNVSPSGKNLVVNQTVTVTPTGIFTIPEVLDSVSSPYVITAKKGITVQTGGTFNLENNAQLMQDESAINVGSITAKRNATVPVSAFNQYVYWSSPVDTQNFKDIYPGNPTTAIYYNETNDKFYTSSGVYIAGRGLAVRNPITAAGSAVTLGAEFKGVPFVGDLNYPLAFTDASHGNNLVGNPYPSNIDIKKLYEDSPGITENFLFWDNSANAINVQQGSAYKGAAYAVFNAKSGTGGTGNPAPGNTVIDPNNPASPAGTKTPIRIVKVGQGFMVKAKGAGTLNFKNSQRIADQTASNFFGKNQTQQADDRYWLQLVTPSNLLVSNAVVYFEGGNNGFAKDDSEETGTSDALFTFADDKKVVINGRNVFSTSDVLELGTRHFTSGTYKIQLGTMEGIFANGQSVYLKDKQTGIITNLSAGTYSFSADAGERTGRFEIVYQPETVLATDSAVKGEVVVYRDGTDFVVKAQSKKITELEVYDMAGRLIERMWPNRLQVTVRSEIMSNGAYLLKITQGGATVVKKILK